MLGVGYHMEEVWLTLIVIEMKKNKFKNNSNGKQLEVMEA